MENCKRYFSGVDPKQVWDLAQAGLAYGGKQKSEVSKERPLEPLQRDDTIYYQKDRVNNSQLKVLPPGSSNNEKEKDLLFRCMCRISGLQT